MTQGINASSAVTSIQVSELGPTVSLQLLFAKLQLELAETAKSSALSKMNEIQEAQKEQKLVAGLLNQARQLQSNAKSGTGNCTWDAKASIMPKEMVEYMNKHGLAYDKLGNDNVHNEEEWKVAITSLESRLEQVGTETQQKMVYVQDFMGQYNSYLQGANSQISNSNQTLTSLAKGM